MSALPILDTRTALTHHYFQWGPELDSYSHRAHFEPWALGPADNHGPNMDVKMWSLRGLMEHNGHDFIDILKVDIEGAEFASLDTFFNFFESQARPTSASESPMDFTPAGARYDFAGKPLPIGQLQIELHPRESEESELLFAPSFCEGAKLFCSLKGVLHFPRFPRMVGEDGTPRASALLDRAQLGLRPPYWYQEARPYRGSHTKLPYD